MREVFIEIVNMSITASWTILAVLVLRMFLKKVPRWITVLLWGMVAFRLMCPFSIESARSIIPSTDTIRPEIILDKHPAIDTGIDDLNHTLNPIIDHSFAPEVGESVNPLQIWILVLAIVWIVGMLLLLLYSGISYWRIRRSVETAVLYRENVESHTDGLVFVKESDSLLSGKFCGFEKCMRIPVFQSEMVKTPFILGFIKPRIYLPYHMNKQEETHVIAHEMAHIKRKDHIWKR